MSNEEKEHVKPFSKGYVLRTTAKHMRKSIDISINKTFDRVKDFPGETHSEKGREVFETLSALHQMRSNLDAFQKQFADDFRS